MTSEQIVFIGASTGGTEAIKTVLQALPRECPPILIAQHMPAAFTKPFAERLDALSAMAVTEAVEGELLRPGHAYVAPGGAHLEVARTGSGFVTRLTHGAPVNRVRPSVDVLFFSAAECVGPLGVGVILTGMGKDGAAGLMAMKQAGAHTFAQDAASCVVFGMPKAAIAMGAVDEIVAIEAMGQRLLQRLAYRARSAAPRASHP